MFWPFKRKARRQQQVSTRTLLVFAVNQDGGLEINFSPAGSSSLPECDKNMYHFCVFLRDLLRGDKRIRKELLDTIKHSSRLPPAVLERTVKTLEKMGNAQDVIEPDLVFPDMIHQ